jgi:hypothetical protein
LRLLRTLWGAAFGGAGALYVMVAFPNRLGKGNPAMDAHFHSRALQKNQAGFVDLRQAFFTILDLLPRYFLKQNNLHVFFTISDLLPRYFLKQNNLHAFHGGLKRYF